MRLLRHGEIGREHFGLADDEGNARDAAALTADIESGNLVGVLDRLRNVDPRELPLVGKNTRLGCPVGRVGKVVCVGLNYSDHAAESGMALPQEPVLFMKANTSISGPNDDICIPPEARKVDWEVELGVVIRKRTTRIAPSDAFSHIAGYVIIHDVSERAYQLERSGQWLKGKSLDTFCPVGPWLVTQDEIPDPQQLRMHLDFNGRRMQDGSARTMIFDVAFLIPYISQFMTLEAGDLISTGTPAGVGMAQQPPVFLNDGDIVELSVEKLGTQRQRVRQIGSSQSN